MPGSSRRGCNDFLACQTAQPDSRNGRKEVPQATARRTATDLARHRRGDRHRHLRAHGRSRAEVRPRHDDRVRDRRGRLRIGSAGLCGTRLDAAGVRLRLYLYVRRARRVPRMDRRLGPGAGIRHRRIGGVGRLVRLHERPADAQRPVRPRATGRVGAAGIPAQRPVHRRRLQPARVPDLAGRHLSLGNRHLEERARQLGAGRDQDHRADRVRADRGSGREERQLRAVPPRRLGQPARRHRRARRGGVDLLRLRRLRCGVDRGRGNQEPEPQHPDRPDRLARGLHDLLPAGRLRCRRLRRRAADARCRRHRSRSTRAARR